MSRYADDYDEPSIGHTAKARLFVVGFIVLGIFVLGKMSQGSRDTQGGADSLTNASAGAVGTQATGLQSQFTENQQSTNPGHIVLQAMLDTYKQLPALREQSRLQIEIDRPGQGSIRESIDLKLSYESPNRLRYVVSRPKNEVTVACNGKQLLARIANPATGDFDGQVVRRPAPRQVDVSTVFSATEFADPGRPNELLSALMDLPADMTVSSLGMLTDRGALPQMLQQATDITQLRDEQIQNTVCSVVRVVGRQGTYKFWIDKSTNLLRQVEHPVTRIVGTPSADGTAGPKARLVSEHACDRNPLFAAKEFELMAPEEATLVRHFVAPPADQDVGHLNVRVPPFAFTDLAGEAFDSQRWDGKHAMLIWFNRHPACQQLLQSLRPVFEQYRDDPRMFFCGVSTEPTTKMGHQELRNLAASWGLPITVVRDLDLVGRDIFSVQQAPTIVVTSPDPGGGSRIQVVEVGWHEQLAQQLPVVIDKLLNGENVAEDFIQFVAKRERDYKRYLASASVDAPTTQANVLDAEIATASEFSRLSLTPLWETRELESPGNISVDYANGEPVLLVHNGWQEVASISANGQILSRNAIHQGTEISRLQILTMPNGEALYAGSALMGKHAALFDRSWRQLLRYPNDAGNARIQDVLLTDLDADGKLEMYVGFAGTEGVHRVDLNGNQVWANRQLSSVLSMTAVDSESGPQLLVTSNDGSLVPIDANGQVGQPFSIGARAIHHLLAGPAVADEKPWYCGLTYNVHGNLFVVGLNDQLNEVWNYPLPPGSSKSQIKIGRYGQVVPGANWQWIFAAPDGSVHIVSPDGQFHDRWNIGRQVNGVASYRVGETHVLVVSSDNAVKAFTVSLR